MTHTYNILGLTCNGCVAKAKSELLKLGEVTEAKVQLNEPQATITMVKHIPTGILQNALNKAGNYTITEADEGMHDAMEVEETKSWFTVYKPIIIVGSYITGITILIEASRGIFVLQEWMMNFMAGFFLVFSFFKFLDVKGFAESYSSYDIIAKKWMKWGYVYAFIELALGISFLLRWNPLLINGVTFAVMSVSIIGVLQSVLNKSKIKCACLGTVFDLPMSTITIIEDALMILMSAVMLITMI
jgi:copper chaperone CopZ